MPKNINVWPCNLELKRAKFVFTNFWDTVFAHILANIEKKNDRRPLQQYLRLAQLQRRRRGALYRLRESKQSNMSSICTVSLATNQINSTCTQEEQEMKRTLLPCTKRAAYYPQTDKSLIYARN